MKIKKRSGEFRGKNWCAAAREWDELKLESPKNTFYDNAIIVKEIIKGFFQGKYEISDFSDWSYVKKKYKLNTTNFLFLCNC